MSDMSFDFSELDKLAADLGGAAENSGSFIRKAVEVTARHVKDDWRDKLKGEPHIPHAPSSITYDLKGGEAIRGSVISAEIGAEKGRLQAPIVVVIESGSPHSAPRGYGAGALAENQGDFEKGLTKALDDALKKAGL